MRPSELRHFSAVPQLCPDFVISLDKEDQKCQTLLKYWRCDSQPKEQNLQGPIIWLLLQITRVDRLLFARIQWD